MKQRKRKYPPKRDYARRLCRVQTLAQLTLASLIVSLFILVVFHTTATRELQLKNDNTFEVHNSGVLLPAVNVTHIETSHRPLSAILTADTWDAAAPVKYNTTEPFPGSKSQSLRSIPVLLLACNRAEVKRTLNSLIAYRKQLVNYSFPITVSHGCHNEMTANVLKQYGNQIRLIKPATLRKPEFKWGFFKHRNRLDGYRAVAKHYKFALDYMFLTLNSSAVIVVEDDLNIAPDFFHYFAATLPLLQMDPTLFCVSAWNDNGRDKLIDKRRNDLIYRTDFFSGLGWMLLRSFWLEIRSDWPEIYWDEYLRDPHIRKNRSCLRPELGRTTTFGEVGVSGGQFFHAYLKKMYLNQEVYDFLTANLTYLLEPGYTKNWLNNVYHEAVDIPFQNVILDRLPLLNKSVALRVNYQNQMEFEQIARRLHMMWDLRGGVSRTAFRGVVPVQWRGHTLFVAPGHYRKV